MGWASLYDYNSNNGVAAYKVSFDRPYEGSAGTGSFFQGDFEMIEYLESQGYNVSYVTSVDTETNPNLMNNHKVFASAYHDEYWSMNMRNTITTALNQGKSLAFFGANNIYWQIRFENSANGTPDRVIACYKDATVDPLSQSNPSLTTVQWRQAPVNMPENALLGVMYDSAANYPTAFPWVVTNASSWVYNGTGLNNGDSIPNMVGYEWDKVFDNGLTPAGLTILSASPVTDNNNVQSVSNSGIYTASSGGMVFDAGTIFWSWKVSDQNPNNYPIDSRVQLMTSNILNTMISGVTPTPTPTNTPTSTPTPGTSYSSTVLSDSPLAYWRLGDAVGSTQALDSSGNGYTATYSGGVTLGVPGALSNDPDTAVSTNGTGKITPPTLATVTNFTIEGWSYLTDATWNSANYYDNTLYGRSGDVRLIIRPGAVTGSTLGYFGVWLSGREYYMQPSSNGLSNMNQWVYWALVRNGSTLTLYRNGVQVSQITNLPATATANISGTLLAQDTSLYFKGDVDEVALYASALSAARIQAHYASAL